MTHESSLCGENPHVIPAPSCANESDLPLQTNAVAAITDASEPALPPIKVGEVVATFGSMQLVSTDTPLPIVFTREREQPSRKRYAHFGSGVEALNSALAKIDYPATSEPLIESDDVTELCFGDVDYHYSNGSIHCEHRPAHLKMRLESIPTTPLLIWITHGGGGRMVHIRVGQFAANELALLSAFYIVRNSHRFYYPTGVEVKSSTRHPHYSRGEQKASPPMSGGPTLTEHGVRYAVCQILGAYGGDDAEYDPDEVVEFLEERGLSDKDRFPHTECPFDPSESSGNDPVVILDSGIYCHKCGKLEPFAKLLGNGQNASKNPLLVAVKRMTHFAQAELLLIHFGGLVCWKSADRRTLWKALLKAYHLAGRPGAAPVRGGETKSDDDRADAEKRYEAIAGLIERAVYDNPIIRVDGGWAHQNDPSKRLDDAGLNVLVALLPMVWKVSLDTKKGLVEKHPVRYSLALNNGSLEKYGYLDVVAIRGADIRDVIGDPERWEHTGTVPTLVTAVDPPFRYRNAADREGCWEKLAKYFPNVNQSLIKILVAALGFCQNNPHEPVRVLITGQSGSGKSAHVTLAAAICGVPVSGVRFNDDTDKLRRSYAACEGGFAIMDEFAKVKSRGNDAERTEALINLKRGEPYHALHVGSALLNATAPLILCDTTCPQTMREETQLARRFVYVPLGEGIGAGSIDWRATSGGDIATWRARNGSESASIADAIISEVMDDLRCLPTYSATFEEYAAKFKFYTLDKQDDGIDADEPFRKLFLEAIQYGGMTQKKKDGEKQNGTFKGRGWCPFNPFATNNSLAAAWRACGGRDDDVSAQPISGKQWARILAIQGVELDVTFPKGSQIGIRFRIGESRSPLLKVGLELIPDGHALRSELCAESPAETLPFVAAKAISEWAPATTPVAGNGGNMEGTVAGT